MSNNIFNWTRFQLLFKQHFIQNSKFLLLAAGAYVGVIFIVLSFAQAGDGLRPNGIQTFQGLLMGCVTVFGILYVGHSFPGFRSKESSISYLMMPASALEKFSFEFVSRIMLSLLMLPLLYWVTFHLHGYFFTIFTDHTFKPVGLKYLVQIDENVPGLIYYLVASGMLFALSLAFTGATMFTKQPLVKSLFAVAVVVMFFVGYSYIVIEPLGVGRYNPPGRMVLVPLEEKSALITVTLALFTATVVMLFVAYNKLKEREV